MMVLVDTSVWSLALRRRQTELSPAEGALSEALGELVREGRSQIVGPVRQELLSGIRGEEGFRKLRDYLRAFDDPQLQVEDYEEAARMNNACRTRGIAGSPVDFCKVPQGFAAPALRTPEKLSNILSFSIVYKPSNAPISR